MSWNQGPQPVIISGAPRSGTSLLADLLSQSPEIQCPYPKEPQFFVDEGFRRLGGPGDSVLRPHLIADWDGYVRRMRARSNASLVIDASTWYCLDGNSMWRASGAFSEQPLKNILCLREPTSRLVSAYAYLRRQGRETERLPAALHLEEERKAAGWSPIWWYRRGSDYSEMLSAAEAVPNVETLVVDYHSLARRPRDVARSVVTWLGCTPPTSWRVRVVNDAVPDRSSWRGRVSLAASGLRRVESRVPGLARLRPFGRKLVRSLASSHVAEDFQLHDSDLEAASMTLEAGGIGFQLDGFRHRLVGDFDWVRS